MKKFFLKYREGVMYLIFGVLTTAVNWVVSFILAVFGVSVELNTAAAWFVAVLFAYFTNRKWVFETADKKNLHKNDFIKEVSSFYAARIISGIIDVMIMTAGVRLLGLWFWGVKVFSQIFVIVFNYVAGKYFVFKKK